MKPGNPLFDNVLPSMMCALRISRELSDGIFADMLRLNSLSLITGKLLKLDHGRGGNTARTAPAPVFCGSQNISPDTQAASLVQVGYKNHPRCEKM